MNTRTAAIAELERRIGHSFSDRALFERALTHGSVTKGSARIGDNERLEFLGDRVLNLVVAEQLMALEPEATEGALSKLMNQLVNYHACAGATRCGSTPAPPRSGPATTTACWATPARP
jgi:ribonuclease-3